jgi:hypothetical protein
MKKQKNKRVSKLLLVLILAIIGIIAFLFLSGKQETKVKEIVVSAANSKQYIKSYEGPAKLVVQKSIKDPEVVDIEEKLDKEISKEIQEDLKLSIEDLKKKYPIEWLKKRYLTYFCETDDFLSPNYFGWTKDKAELTSRFCNSKDHLAYEYNDAEIKSLFFDGDYLVQKAVLCDIYDNQKNSKWYHLENLFYKKDILSNVNWFVGKYDKDKRGSYECIPQDLPYFKEVLFKKINHPSSKRRLSDISNFSKEIQEEYKIYWNNLNKNK